jgi:hypothetical protein
MIVSLERVFRVLGALYREALIEARRACHEKGKD